MSLASPGACTIQNAICPMDEPLSNLDVQLRHDMRVEIRVLQRLRQSFIQACIK
jgi:ABC-type sugar transport system ATPase subunit